MIVIDAKPRHSSGVFCKIDFYCYSKFDDGNAVIADL